jgi:hypothetical protein
MSENDIAGLLFLGVPMATYDELYSLRNNSALKNKVEIATVIAAETIMNEDGGTTNHANRLIWASAVFANPKAEANRMFMAVLAANADQTVVQITGATDAAIQTNVDDHVDLFATG